MVYLVHSSFWQITFPKLTIQNVYEIDKSFFILSIYVHYNLPTCMKATNHLFFHTKHTSYSSNAKIAHTCIQKQTIISTVGILICMLYLYKVFSLQ